MPGLLSLLTGTADANDLDPQSLGLLGLLAGGGQGQPGAPQLAGLLAQGQPTPKGLLAAANGINPDLPAPGAQPMAGTLPAPADGSFAIPGQTPAPAPPQGADIPFPMPRPADLPGATQPGPVIGTDGKPPSIASQFASGADRVLNGLGNIYGNGGAGDGMINLGLALMSPGNRADNMMRAAAATASQQTARQSQLLNSLKLQQQLGSQQGNTEILKRAYPNMSDAEIYAAAQQPSLVAEALKRVNPSEQYVTLPADEDGNIFQKNLVTGQMTKLAESKGSTTPLITPADRAAAGISPDDTAPYQKDDATGKVSAIGGGGVKVYNGDAGDYGAALTKSLSAPHAALIGDAPAAQQRLQDIHAMQAAVQRIRQNGGTTGIGQDELTKLKGMVNSGANALGIDQPYDISDPEFLTKFNRQLAGGQAKAVGGARTTNFELNNYLNANPGLAMSPTGNERLLGIMEQIEQRNVAVGQALAQSTAAAISQHRTPNAADNQKLITDFDAAHPIIDPITGQDLTKKVAVSGLGSAPTSSGSTTTSGQPGARKFPSFKIVD